MLPEIVYGLCAATSIACAGLLIRGYRRSRARILLWSSLSFCFLAANNTLLVLDLVVFPTSIDLLPYRDLTAFFSALVLVAGLAWDGD